MSFPYQHTYGWNTGNAEERSDQEMGNQGWVRYRNPSELPSGATTHRVTRKQDITYVAGDTEQIGQTDVSFDYYRPNAPAAAPAPQPAPTPAPAPAPAPASSGGSAAAQATANTAATTERDYRANIPRVEMGAIKPGTSWDTLENGRWVAPHEGGSKDNDRNREIDTSNANFATKAMTEYGAKTQDNYGRFVDSLRADALNNSAQMKAADEANIARLSPNLALKNPGDELKGLYGDISDKMKGYLFV